MNWIMKGVKKELLTLKDFKTWYLVSAVVGFSTICVKLFNIPVMFMSISLLICSIVLFVLNYYFKTSSWRGANL
jgi:hypothetical protein